MAENDNPTPARQKKEKKLLALAFLYADVGEKVLKLLREDNSCGRVFPPEIAGRIRAKREDYATNTEYKQQVVMPVMEAFLEKACPTVRSNPEMARWVCNQYLTHRHNGKPVKAEDLYKIGQNITFFNGVKTSPDFKEQKKHLLQYDTYAAFQQMLKPYRQAKEQKNAEARDRHMDLQERTKLMSETTILYDGPEGQVVVPHTSEASKYWGNNTEWCIAGKGCYEDGREYAATHFPDYNAKSPIIMLLPKGQSDNKIALVDHILYNSKDEEIPALPQPHNSLMQRCLEGLSAGARENIAMWMAKKKVVPAEPSNPAMVKAFEDEWNNISKGNAQNNTLWSNRDFVLAAPPEYSFSALRHHAAEELRQDRELVLAAVRQYNYVLPAAAEELKYDQVFITRLLEEVDDLPFNIRDITDCSWDADSGELKTFPSCWQPDDATLAGYQVKALERILERGDIEKFAGCARRFKIIRDDKSAWGNPDKLFALDPATMLVKIKAEVAAQHPAVGSVAAPPPRRAM